jgi:NADPH:quinone reductase-like Zn-dependent oxidoreductase
MKAIRIHNYGHSDQIHLEEASAPTPKDNQLLVQVRDIGVNPVDWKIREGHMKDFRPANFPLTLGQDFAGEVLTVGSAVTQFGPGDRVYGFADGSYAEQALVTEDKISFLPDDIDFVTAASLPTAGITAYQLIMTVADLQQGQSILIHGAGGGVGSFAVQLALWKGAHVCATAAETDFPYLKSLGVQALIDYKKDRFQDLVHSVDVVLDLVGGETLNRSFDVVRAGGIVATTVGPVDLKIAGAKRAKAIQFMARPNSHDLWELAKLVELGVIQPRIHEVLPLEEARRAQDELQKGHSQGKIILEVRS